MNDSSPRPAKTAAATPMPIYGPFSPVVPAVVPTPASDAITTPPTASKPTAAKGDDGLMSTPAKPS